MGPAPAAGLGLTANGGDCGGGALPAKGSFVEGEAGFDSAQEPIGGCLPAPKEGIFSHCGALLVSCQFPLGLLMTLQVDGALLSSQPEVGSALGAFQLLLGGVASQPDAAGRLP